jgi:glycosyltransferase involved in cell wall biosynthesis
MLGAILHVNEKGGQFGGTEEYIATLSSMLHLYGISSSLIYGTKFGDIPDAIAAHFHVPGLSVRGGGTDAPHRVLEIVRRLKPDVVYIHNIFDATTIRLMATATRAYALLWYVHDHFPTCLTELRANGLEPGFVCRRLLSSECLAQVAQGHCMKRFEDMAYSHQDLESRLGLMEAARHVDAVITVSQFMRGILVANLPEISNKIRVLPRQVRGSAKSKSTSHNNEERIVITYCGRIVREKGLRLALSALTAVRSPGEIVFRIAGVIEDAAYWNSCLAAINEICSHNAGVSIEYRGFLPYSDVDALYDTSDVLILPSIWGEPSGTVAAEALAHGVPVVAFDVGGISMWVRHEETGLLVTPKDVTALGAAVERLVQDPSLRAKLGANGRRLVAQHFTNERHLKSLLSVIAAIMPYRQSFSEVMASKRGLVMPGIG